MLPLMNGMIEKLEKGINVLDIGCGSLTATNTLAKVFPNSTFSGIDFFKEYLEQNLEPFGEGKKRRKYLKRLDLNQPL